MLKSKAQRLSYWSLWNMAVFITSCWKCSFLDFWDTIFSPPDHFSSPLAGLSAAAHTPGLERKAVNSSTCLLSTIHTLGFCVSHVRSSMY